MKYILIVSTLLLLISGNSLAGSNYDRCIKDEKALKVQEAADCSGLKYLLNPSACFATQKLLKEYKAGKCRQIGVVEDVDFSASKVPPEKIERAISNASSVSSGTSVEKVNSVSEKKTEPEVAQQESTIEQFKEENARLKAEIKRLGAENEQLRKTGR